MKNIPLYTFALLLHCGPSALAQAPAGKEAAPPANAPANAPAPAAAQPSRAAVEKYVTELKEYIAVREESVTRIVGEITAQDKSIQAAVDKITQILTASKDSVDTRSKVTQLKQDTMNALKRAIQKYAEKRSQIAEELRQTKNNYRRDDLFNSRGEIDTRIEKMVDSMLQLALSMEVDEGHERYVQDSSVMVGGRYGISVPTTKRNAEYDQNKKQTARTEKVGTALDQALEASLKRLETQERDVVAKMAKTEMTDEEKKRLGEEIERIQAIRQERLEQKALLEGGANPGLQSELDKKGFAQTEELVESITAGARRDFTRMIASFNDLRAERQSLSSLRAKLDHAVKWLETNKDAK